MSITIAMITQKDFKIKVRGYDQDEVDEFLDLICDDLEIKDKLIEDLRGQVNDLLEDRLPNGGNPSPQVVDPQTDDKAAAPSDLEAASQLLAGTQKLCDEILADARKRAAILIQDAQNRSNPEMEAIENENNALKKENASLRAEAQRFKNRISSLLKDQDSEQSSGGDY